MNFNIAITVSKDAYIYRKEKDLLYASTFITGTVMNEDETLLKISSPLFYDAQIEVAGEKGFLSIDRRSFQINSGF